MDYLAGFIIALLLTYANTPNASKNDVAYRVLISLFSWIAVFGILAAMFYDWITSLFNR